MVMLCPNCKKPTLIQHAGGISGLYECKNCDYIGTLVIEYDPEEKE